MIAGLKIPQKSISKLFWGRFPYKVLLEPLVFNTSTSPFSGKQLFLDIESHLKSLENYLQYAPKNSKTWHTKSSPKNFTIFFDYEKDLEYFVRCNQQYVREIWLPENDQALEVLQSKANIEIRDILYWSKYRYCVHFNAFKFSKLHIQDEIDSWVQEVFGIDDDRLYYGYDKQRKIYFADFNDVVMTQLAYSTDIQKITKAILRSELNELETCPKID